MKITDDIFKSIFNGSVWISITISLKFIPKGPIDYKSALVQVMAWHRTGEKPLPESMLTQFTDAYHDAALGGNKITKSGRSFTGVWYILFSLLHCQNSPKIFHTVFETLPVGAKLLPILTLDYCHPPQSNFKEYKQDMVAVFLCTCQWSMSWLARPVLLGSQWVNPCLPSPMHDWAAGAAKQVTQPAHLRLSAIRLHWGTLCFISGNGAHVCWIEEKYMVIHIYGITLNAAKSADQYSSSYSYQSLSLISYLMYNDLHHDCKPYEQTRDFITVSLYSP